MHGVWGLLPCIERALQKMQGMDGDIYRFVISSWHSRCIFNNTSVDHGPEPSLIVQHTDKHAAKASRYRLNQNSGLSKALDIKAKENALKQQGKAETVTLKGQLYMFSGGLVTAKKVSYIS